MNGTPIDFPAASIANVSASAAPGTAQGYLAAPAGGASGPGVLVLHAWWGLNDTFRSFCDRLAAEGFVALAPDLYGEGKTADTIEGAKALLNASDEALAQGAILGALDRLLDTPQVPPGGIGVVGFSMGVGFALWVSEERSSDVGAVVAAYGTHSPRPGRSPVQGHFASDDEFESAEEVETFVAGLREEGRSVETFSYAGTNHWFMEADRPQFDSGAAELATERILEFLRRNLAEEAA